MFSSGKPRFFVIVFAVLAGCAEPPPRRQPPPAPRLAPAPAATSQPMPSTLPELLSQIEAAYRRGDYDRGLALVKRTLELKQTDVTTLDRIGSIYYVLGRYGEALTFWRRALPLEQDVERRRELERSIAVARRSLGLGDEAASPSTLAAARPAGPTTSVDRERSEALYKKGVKYYAEGEYLQATTAFLQALALDPNNVDAKRALERLRVQPDGAPAP